MTYLRTGLTLTATLALTVSYLPPAYAQAGGGYDGTFSFSQGVEFGGKSDADLTTRTRLGFTVESETRTETLQLRLGSELIGEFGGRDDEFDLKNTDLGLNYGRRGSNSALSFSAFYRETQLSDSVVVSGPDYGIGFASSQLVIDRGTATTESISASLSMGIEAPFGFDLRARSFSRTYDNTINSDLFDTSTNSVDGVARFRIRPSLTARALAGLSDTDEEDFVHRDIRQTYVGVGLGGANGSGLSFTSDLIFDRAERSTPGSPTFTNDGVGMDLQVQQERRDGALGFAVSSRIGDDGRRSTASVNRAYAFPTGQIRLELGMVDQEADTSVRPSANVAYRRETPVGDVTASLTHVPTIDNSVVYTNTTVAVDLAQEINEISGWTAGLAYSSLNEIGGGDDDTRTTATVAYTRSLTEDWRMRTGVEHLRESVSGSDTETSNTLFFNIERDFSFGF